MQERQQLAMSGQLRPDDQLYDSVRGVWQRATDYPALQPYLPAPQVNWPAVLGLGALARIALAAARSWTNDRLRGLSWIDLKREIFRRDSYTCVYCGHRGNAPTLHVDHVTPLSRGGSDDPENLATACWFCNLEKGTRTGSEYRWWRLNGR
jgi:5-methylcytosine-specific restriction endonuclease McrA